MPRPGWAVLAVSLLAPAAAADDAKAVLDKAVRAYGGPTAVAKLRVVRIKAEGTARLAADQPAVSFVIEDVWQMPDKYRTSSTFTIAGKPFTQVQVIDGKKGWAEVGGQVQDMPRAAFDEMAEQKYAEDLDRLAFVGQPGYDVRLLPESQVGGKPAVGVLVQAKGHRDVKLYFDAATGLLAKREQTILDPETKKDVPQEVVFGDYKETDGVRYPRSLTLTRDGQKLLEAKVTELEFLTKPDPKLFARP